MSTSTHLAASGTSTASTTPTPQSRPRLALVGARDSDDREAAARAASMARHPAGKRARVTADPRATSMARHP